jgi:hypothetical protein
MTKQTPKYTMGARVAVMARKTMYNMMTTSEL